MFSSRWALILLVFLAACGEAAAEEVLLAEILLPLDAVEAAGLAFTTEEARHGRITRTSSIPVSPHFPVAVDLSFTLDGGRLSYRNASIGQMVEAGDVLFSISFDEDALRVEEQQLLLRMAEAERRHSNELTRRRAGMVHDITPLRAEELEAEYQNAVWQFERQQRDRLRRLEEIRGKIAGEDIIAPFDAMVGWADVIRLNTLMDNRARMVTLYDYSVFQVTARAAPDIMRFGDVLTINDRNQVPRGLKVVSDPLVANVGRADTFEFILKFLDSDVTIADFQGQEGGVSANPVSIDVEGVIVPTRAVQSGEGRHFVFIYEDGVIRRRYVQVGMVYGHESQILDGVQAGQLLVIH